MAPSKPAALTRSLACSTLGAAPSGKISNDGVQLVGCTRLQISVSPIRRSDC